MTDCHSAIHNLKTKKKKHYRGAKERMTHHCGCVGVDFKFAFIMSRTPSKKNCSLSTKSSIFEGSCDTGITMQKTSQE